MFRRRGRSEEPELTSHRSPVTLMAAGGGGNGGGGGGVASHYGARARSAGPQSSSYRKRPPAYGVAQQQPQLQQQQQQQHLGERAVINPNVNPYHEFPSLRHGGMPALPQAPCDVLSARPDPSRDGDVFSYYFWAAVIFMAVCSVINITVNLALIHVYDMSPTFGMGGLEYFPESNVLAYTGKKEMEVDQMVLDSGLITGFEDETLRFSADGGDIVFRAVEPGADPEEAPEMRLSGEEGLSVKNVENVRFVDPDTGEVYFDFNKDKIDVSGEYDTISADTVETDGIYAPLGEDLFIKSDGEMNLGGMEGIEVSGREVTLEAPSGTIDLSSSAGEIVLDGSVAIDPRGLPQGGHGYPGEEPQFKLCVCMPSGMVYRVAVPSPPFPPGAAGPDRRPANCDQSEDWDYHPCTGERLK